LPDKNNGRKDHADSTYIAKANDIMCRNFSKQPVEFSLPIKNFMKKKTVWIQAVSEDSGGPLGFKASYD
jgi:hypothetical protein